jgi:hypothetical protein
MLTEEDKKYILNQFLINISGISDKEYQKRVWIRGEGPECDDFDETVCQFLDSWRFISEKYQDFQITDPQYQLLKEFREKFEVFADDNYWPPEFIDSPEWEKIMEMAKNVLNAFNFQKNS